MSTHNIRFHGEIRNKYAFTVEPQCREHLWDHKKIVLEIWVVPATEGLSLRQVRRLFELL